MIKCSVKDKDGPDEQIVLLHHVGFEVIGITMKCSLVFNSLFWSC